MAKVTLEVDDKTAAGFASYIKHVEQSDQETRALKDAAGELSKAVSVLSQQQQQQIMATQQQTIAIQENRAGFMEWTNTLFEFGKNMRDVGGWIRDTTHEMYDTYRSVRRTIGAYNLLAFAITRVSRTARKFAPALLGVKIATAAVDAAFEATGKRIVAVEGPASDAAKRLASEINSGLSTVEEVVERTGKSMEELGLAVESNADRIEKATAELSSTASQHMGRLWDAFMAPLPIITDAWDAFTGEMESKFAEFTRNSIENTQMITDALNEFMGLNAKAVREQNKFLAREEALKEVRQAYRAFEADLERQIELRKELNEIAKIHTQNELDLVLQAERQKRAELDRTGQWTAEEQQKHFARLRAIKDRELSLISEVERKKAEYVRESLENARRAHESHLRYVARQEEIAAEKRKARMDEERAYAETIRNIKADAEAAAANRNIEIIKNRIDLEIEDEEKKLEIITRLEKEAIMNRAAAEMEGAKDRIEQARIAARAKQDILDAELRLTIDYERQKAQAEREAREKSIKEAREKFEKEVALLKDKLMEEKRLAGGGSQSELGKLAGSFSQEQVREEIVQNRLQSGARAGRNQDGRRLTEQEIRRMVIREMRSGGVNQEEVQKAQSDLLKQTANQGFQSGKFSKATAQAIHQAANAIEKTNAQQEELAQEVADIAKFIKGNSEASSRRQAQRRGTRR